jgi:hypothetical protein
MAGHPTGSQLGNLLVEGADTEGNLLKDDDGYPIIGPIEPPLGALPVLAGG